MSLGDIGEPAFNPLIAALQDEDANVRKWAAFALGEIGDPRAVEPLIEALQDEHWEVRGYAAWSLGRFGDSKAIDPLTYAASSDEEEMVREAAAEALEKIKAE